MKTADLLTFAVTAVIVFAGMKSCDSPDDPQTVIHIENSFNSIGAPLGINGAEVLSILTGAIKQPPMMTRSDHPPLPRTIQER